MLFKKPFFPFLFLLILTIAVLQHIAVQFYLYWVFGWFDIMMHFLGGFWFGFTAVWLLFFSGYLRTPRSSSFKTFFAVSLGTAFVVGVLWEVFEYYAGLTFTVDAYVLDTVLDIIMDSIGGVIAGLFLYYSYKHKS